MSSPDGFSPGDAAAFPIVLTIAAVPIASLLNEDQMNLREIMHFVTQMIFLHIHLTDVKCDSAEQRNLAM